MNVFVLCLIVIFVVCLLSVESKSKCMLLRKKYKIIRKVKEYYKKKVKEVKKLGINKKVKVEKDLGIFNVWFFKE